MARIISYPPLETPTNSDLLIVSDVSAANTKSLNIEKLSTHVIVTNSLVKGSGTNNYVTQWVDANNREIGDSPAFTVDGGAGLKQFILGDGYRFVVDRDAATTLGDPEYAITQNGVAKTSFGWDDDGGGFGFLYNWAGKGFKFGGAALYPQLELLTDPDIKTISFADFEFDADIIDVTGSVGIAGQVLSSLGAGNGVQWINAGGGGGGTVGGSGSSGFIAKWTSANTIGTSNIQDSGIDLQINADISFTGGIDVSMDGNRIQDVGTPTLSNDAATKNYVDNFTDIRKVEITLTPAQLLTLDGGGSIILLTAPDVNKMYWILNGLINLEFNSVAYNFTPADPLTDGVSMKIGSLSLFDDVGVFTTNLNSASSTYFVNDPIRPTSQSLNAAINAPLTLDSTSGISVSQGNSPLNFSLLYREIDVSFT